MSSLTPRELCYNLEWRKYLERNLPITKIYTILIHSEILKEILENTLGKWKHNEPTLKVIAEVVVSRTFVSHKK